METQCRAIIIRSIKYGDTSLIVDLITEAYGRLSFMIKGARKPNKSGASKSNLLQIGAMVNLNFRYQQDKHFQIARTISLEPVCIQQIQIQQLACITYCAEVCDKAIHAAEHNEDFFEFIWQCLYECYTNADLAYLPLYFTLHTARFLGFEIIGRYSDNTPVLDLANGSFTTEKHAEHICCTGNEAILISDILDAENVRNLVYNFTRKERIGALNASINFINLHTVKPVKLQSIDVWQSVL